MRRNTTLERTWFRPSRRSALSLSYQEHSRKACSIVSSASQTGHLGFAWLAHSVSQDPVDALPVRTLMRRVAFFQGRPFSRIGGRLVLAVGAARVSTAMSPFLDGSSWGLEVPLEPGLFGYVVFALLRFCLIFSPVGVLAPLSCGSQEKAFNRSWRKPSSPGTTQFLTFLSLWISVGQQQSVSGWRMLYNHETYNPKF